MPNQQPRTPGPPRKPDPDLARIPDGPVQWYAGSWRTPAGIEAYRLRARRRQRQRRADGTGR